MILEEERESHPKVELQPEETTSLICVLTLFSNVLIGCWSHHTLWSQI